MLKTSRMLKGIGKAAEKHLGVSRLILSSGNAVVSLKSKILIILVVTVVLYALLNYGVQKWIIFPNFQKLEQREASRSIERIIETLRREGQHLNSLCHDWASWDDTYHFIQNISFQTAQANNEKYMDSVLLDSSLVNDHLNLVCFYDSQGRMIWKKAIDLRTKKMLDLPDFGRRLPLDNPLMGKGSLDAPLSGIFMTKKGPMLVASRPILTSNGLGPAQGRLIMGRFINHSIAMMLSNQTRAKCALLSLAEGNLSLEDRNALKNMSGRSPFYTHPKNDKTILAYTLIPDIFDQPAILMRVDTPRDIIEQGMLSIRSAILSLMIISLLILLVMMILLQKIVVGPISNLTAQAEAIRIKSTDSAGGLKVQSNDEIGILAQEFNQLLQKLAKTREDLQKQSYYSGMAEMAGEVLHSIRNNLGPMIFNVDLLRQNLNAAPIPQIQLAQNELINDSISEDRRRDLLQFQQLALQKLANHMDNLNTGIEEITACGSRIEKVLADRDKFTQAPKQMETLLLVDAIRDAIASIAQPTDIPINYEMDENVRFVAPILANRPPLVHVLANLISNATDSIKKANIPSGKIRIYAAPEQVNDVNMVHLRIADNGVGIEPEQLEKIFDREYPRKQECKMSLGLHWCSNTISAMNGRIYAESDGKGKGACFHVLIPRSI